MLPFNLQPPKINQFQLPSLPPPPQFSKQSPRLTQEQEEIFSSAELMNTNTAQPQLLFPQLSPQTITHLVRCFSDENVLSRVQYLDVELFLNRIIKVFKNAQQPFQYQNLTQAAQILGLNQNMQILQNLYEKYEQNNQIDQNGVISIFSYLRLCQRLLEKFDKQNKGYVNLDLKELMNLCFWMI